MNKDNRTAAYVAMYTDDLLKAGVKTMTETESEEMLEQVSEVGSEGLLPDVICSDVV